jgi:predicted Zn-dependent protease
MYLSWRCCAPAAVVILAAASLAKAQTNFSELAKEAQSQVDTNPARAVDLYKEALAGHPDWAEGWLYMGACLFKLGRFAEARDALKKGVAIEPRQGTGTAFLGMAEYELGDYRQALADMLRGETIGLADDPSFIAALRYRAALAALKCSNFVEAMRQLKPLARSGSHSPDVMEAFGLAVLKISESPGNVPASQEPLVQAAGQAAWAYESERLEEANRLLQQLVEQFPYAPHVHYLYGVSLVRSDPAAAEMQFRQELSIAPQNGDAHAQLALLQLASGRSAAALKEAQNAVQLNPNDPWYNATLGRALLEAGDAKGAVAALEKSAQLAPGGALAHFYLARAYRRLGNQAAADKEQLEWQRLHAKQAEITITRP